MEENKKVLQEVLNKPVTCVDFSWERIRNSKLCLFFLYHCIFIVVISILWLLLGYIGIVFRNILSFAIIGWGILGLIISFWWWLIKSKIQIFFKVIIGFIVAGALGYGALVATVLSVFVFSPEHVVEIEDEKYVAVVNVFLDVNVDYYKYYGPLFRGNKRIISGNFGEGGYDPYTSDYHGIVEYHHMDETGEHYLDSWTESF